MWSTRFFCIGLLCGTLASQASSLSTGAYGCNGDEPAVSGLHLSAALKKTGSLADGHLTFAVDGISLVPYVAYDISIGETHTWELSVDLSGHQARPFRGFLVRVNGGDSNVDAADALPVSSSTSSDVQEAVVCGGFAGVGGVTHTGNAEKSSVTGSILLDEASSNMKVDVTVVIENRNDKSAYFYTQLLISAVAPTGTTSSPSAPTSPTGTAPTPTLAPTTPPQTCFSSHATVDVLGTGQVPMHELQVGQYILTGNGQYEPVYAFGHRHTQKSTHFLQIHTTASTGPLEVTTQHLVFLVGETTPVRADSLRAGDILQDGSGSTNHPHTVANINSIAREGLYNPLTPSGTIVVDRILASTYVSFQSGNNSVKLQGGVTTGLTYHDAIHIVLAPFRVICTAELPTKLHESLCNSYNQDGLPHYVAGGIEFIHWGLEQNLVVQCVLLSCSMLICGIFWCFEKLPFGSICHIGWVVMALLAIAISSRVLVSESRRPRSGLYGCSSISLRALGLGFFRGCRGWLCGKGARYQS